MTINNLSENSLIAVINKAIVKVMAEITIARIAQMVVVNIQMGMGTIITTLAHLSRLCLTDLTM